MDDLKNLTNWAQLEAMMAKQSQDGGRVVQEDEFNAHCLKSV